MCVCILPVSMYRTRLGFLHFLLGLILIHDWSAWDEMRIFAWRGGYMVVQELLCLCVLG
jgi:hypothetical protein